MESMEGIKKIIVTGGAGFIGSHLVKKLANIQNFKILVVDIKRDPRSYYVTSNLEKKVSFEFLDIRNRKKITGFIRSYNPNYIFHLAAESIVGKSYNEPWKAFETNIMGTVNVLEGCRDLSSLEGIIIASSDKAYGKTEKAYTEDFPLKGDHPYDVSKSSADLISQAYYKTYGVPVVVTRFGNVYGEGDLNFGRIIPDICQAIIRKNPLLLRSDGSSVRDYVYIKDVVSGYIFLLKNLRRIKGEAFNFSSTDNLSVVELIALSEKILKVKIDYDILNNSQNEIPYQHLNDRKIRKLGWQPCYTIVNTLSKVHLWYKNMLQ